MDGWKDGWIDVPCEDACFPGIKTPLWLHAACSLCPRHPVKSGAGKENFPALINTILDLMLSRKY